MRIFAAALAGVLMLPGMSLAQTATDTTTGTPSTEAAPAAAGVAMPTDSPTAGSMKLSGVIAALESRVGERLGYVDEVEWDDDGYWEVEYYTTDGDKTEVRIDAATGEPIN